MRDVELNLMRSAAHFRSFRSAQAQVDVVRLGFELPFNFAYFSKSPQLLLHAPQRKNRILKIRDVATPSAQAICLMGTSSW